MRKTGGTIAIFAGVFGVLAALLTLVVGGVGSALQADNARLVVGLGWGGLVFSSLTIILGAVCVSARSRMPAAFLIVVALGGMVLGGTVVAICMVLALVGALLAVFAADPADDASPGSKSRPMMDAGQDLTNADEVVARYLQRREQSAATPDSSRPSTSDSSRPSSRPASGGFGKRGQLGASAGKLG
jgi:hypothetical protein